MLEGKVAWVTGASRGIGRATAVELARHGAKLIIGARAEANLADTASEIRELTGTAPIICAYDVSDASRTKEAFSFVHSKAKQLDIMVNNAGVLEDALLGMVNSAQIGRVMSVNLHAILYHMQYASRLMMRRKSGSIINLSSIIGRVGNEGQAVYGASKAAVIGATVSAAKELAPFNIRVNAVAPGFIDTDMIRRLSGEKHQERLRGIKMNRIGKPEEVATVILFLASEMSSYVTGQVIGVDGGMLI